MARTRILPARASRRIPWRNGGGVTEEIAVLPPGTSFERADFDVRISTAAVPGPGPFSAFPGFDRVLVVTRGGGIAVSHGGAAPSAWLPPLVPYAFSGDWATLAERVDGDVADFNVIVRRGVRRADVRIVRTGDAASPAGPGDVFVHALTGPATVRLGADSSAIAAGDTLHAWDGGDGETLSLDGAGAVAVVVRVTG